MKTLSFSFNVMLFCLFPLLWTACSEKDDFLSEPTETSVIVSGQLVSQHGEALAGIPISVDYAEWYWLSPFRKTIHKAKTTTDKNGMYRLFFEAEADQSDDNPELVQCYSFYVDLNALSPDEYLLPSVIKPEIDDNTLFYNFYSGMTPGAQIDFNMYVPRKKLVTVKLLNYGPNDVDDQLAICNAISYGGDRLPDNDMGNIVDGKLVVRNPVELDGGEATATMPCALGDVNTLFVSRDLDVFASKEIVVTEGWSETVVFDNTDIPEESKFKLSVVQHSSFMGEDYPLAAPFDFITCRLTDNQGQYSSTPPAFIEEYDSIVWSVAGLPNTMRIYQKEANLQGGETNFISQWGSYFFQAGEMKNYLKGYRAGEVVYADSVSVTLYERDFLCFDWTKGNVALVPASSEIYCALDPQYSYIVSHTSEVNATRLVEMRVAQPWGMANIVYQTYSQGGLRRLLRTTLGDKKTFEKDGIRDVFNCLPEDVEPVEFYESPTTRVLLVHRPASDWQDDEYYIHIESK